jgi:hypothetical protein
VDFLCNHLDDLVSAALCREGAASARLLDQVEDWMSVICPGVRIEAAVIERTDLVRLGFQVIQSMRNRAPFSDVLPPGAQAGADYRWEGHFAKALGAAHVMDGLLVSLLVDPAWDTSWISAKREELAEDADGQPEIDEYPVDVRHAAKPEHALPHEEWVREAGLHDFRNGTEIWESRGDF